MDSNKILLGIIAILVIALIVLGAYIITTDSNNPVNVDIPLENKTNNTTDVIMIDEDGKTINTTVVGDDSPRNDTNSSNQTYRVYNPQDDAYVTVIGEGYDDEVDRWYTYDTDGVRYYNTRIN